MYAPNTPYNGVSFKLKSYVGTYTAAQAIRISRKTTTILERAPTL